MDTIQKTRNSNVVLFSGIFTLLLGCMVLSGWVFDIDGLTHINPAWNPMVPSTALCFVLSGLALLKHRRPRGVPTKIQHNTYIWLVLLLVGIRATELATGQNFNIEFMLSNLGSRFANVGRMSPLTMAGFLIFAISMLTIRRTGGRAARISAGISAGLLLFTGLAGAIGYWLDFPLIFETFYLKTGLIWMAVHTAIGMMLLGLGLLCLALRCAENAANTVQQQTATIYRSTLLALVATAVATGLAGISFLEISVYSQASSDMNQLLNARVLYLGNNLDNRIQTALVVSLEPEFKNAIILLLKNENSKSAMEQAQRIAAPLLDHKFTGVGLVSGSRKKVIAGKLLPATIPAAVFDSNKDVSLTWDNGYILRVRVPLGKPSRGSLSAQESFLVIEQTLPNMSHAFSEANHWGKSGIMALCARSDSKQLLCFPQRGQPGIYAVQDTFDGKPIPMAYALAGKSNVASLVDYRGHHALAAYGPVGNTGLGLVVRQDLTEIYAPIRDELLIAIPLIIFMIILGTWLIRVRVQPLVTEIAEAHATERSARESFDAAMQSSPDEFVIYQSLKDRGGNIVDFRCVYLNQHAAQMVKLAVGASPDNLPDNLVGHTFLEVFPQLTDAFAKFKTVALTGQMLAEQISLPSHDADATLWHMRLVVAMPKGIAVTYRDITEQKRSEDYIRHLALHDTLTGLPNRALLDDRVTIAISQQRRNKTPFVLAMMDIDRFKHINDTMGHHAGDLLLKGFVNRVNTCLRPTDTLARMGGDEFVLLLAGSDESGADIVMKRILIALAAPINVDMKEVHITSSTGFSVCPRDGMDIDELLRRADVAMYWVKEHGRNGYRFFSPEMDDSSSIS